MPKARKHLISVESTPYYHCVSRCVRRAFLCGDDTFSGQSYEHRRSWVEKRILKLGQLFCIDVCAYAVMSNHYHVVLHINTQAQKALPDHEVLTRWFTLFKGSQLVSRYFAEEPLTDAEDEAIRTIAAEWRERLGNISWFMKVLNEGIAKEANFEDQCTGRFWEGRFKSQALLDEAAVAACMTYVDLNPVRAAMANTPENSDHTSAKKRIAEAKKTPAGQDHPYQPKTLFPFTGYENQQRTEGLPFRLQDYLVLLDWTGRIIRQDKRGSIDAKTPDILTRLELDPDSWLNSCQCFEARFGYFAGAIDKVKAIAADLGYQRAPRASTIPI